MSSEDPTGDGLDDHLTLNTPDNEELHDQLLDESGVLLQLCQLTRPLVEG